MQGFWAPIAARLSPLLSLRIETQQRLHARGRLLDPGTEPITVRATEGGVRLSEAAIPFFVDSDSWALESGRIVTGHTHPLAHDFHGIAEKLLHFVGYVPAAVQQPMHVDCGTDAVEGVSSEGCMGFVVAQWGGVVIMNSASAAITSSRRSEGMNETGMQQCSYCLRSPCACDKYYRACTLTSSIHVAFCTPPQCSCMITSLSCIEVTRAVSSSESFSHICCAEPHSNSLGRHRLAFWATVVVKRSVFVAQLRRPRKRVHQMRSLS